MTDSSETNIRLHEGNSQGTSSNNVMSRSSQELTSAETDINENTLPHDVIVDNPYSGMSNKALQREIASLEDQLLAQFGEVGVSNSDIDFTQEPGEIIAQQKRYMESLRQYPQEATSKSETDKTLNNPDLQKIQNRLTLAYAARQGLEENTEALQGLAAEEFDIKQKGETGEGQTADANARLKELQNEIRL